MLDEFSYLAIAVDRLVVRDDIVRAQLVYYYNHNESGQNLDGRLRHVWQVVDGKVAMLDEYHDVPMLKSFLDMVAGLRKTRFFLVRGGIHATYWPRISMVRCHPGTRG